MFWCTYKHRTTVSCCGCYRTLRKFPQWGCSAWSPHNTLLMMETQYTRTSVGLALLTTVLPHLSPYTCIHGKGPAGQELTVMLLLILRWPSLKDFTLISTLTLLSTCTLTCPFGHGCRFWIVRFLTMRVCLMLLVVCLKGVIRSKSCRT